MWYSESFGSYFIFIWLSLLSIEISRRRLILFSAIYLYYWIAFISRSRNYLLRSKIKQGRSRLVSIFTQIRAFSNSGTRKKNNWLIWSHGLRIIVQDQTFDTMNQIVLVCSLCLNVFSPTCLKAKFRKFFYLFKQILS